MKFCNHFDPPVEPQPKKLQSRKWRSLNFWVKILWRTGGCLVAFMVELHRDEAAGTAALIISGPAPRRAACGWRVPMLRPLLVRKERTDSAGMSPIIGGIRTTRMLHNIEDQ